MRNEGVDIMEIKRELTGWVNENKALIVNKIFTLKGVWLAINSCHITI